ncbi:MAG: hypothetical protein MI861_21905 [Pirellulales bacterium]|nr:hypothetical protein [Pirellulales bacterium]
MNVAVLHCSRCDTPLESGDLRCSICGLSSPHQDENAAKVAVKVLRCKGCGAAIAYDPEHQAPSCSFCGDVVEVESIKDPMEQTEGYLPFTLTPQQARGALQRWLGSLGWFRPSDLLSSSRLEQLKPLWWVGWVFDAESWVSWTADSNAGSGRSAWAPHSGQNEIFFDDILVSASRGLTDSEVNAITPGLNLNSAQTSPQGAADATMEQFDLQRSQARQQITAAIQNLAAQQVQDKHVPGSRFRNLKVSVVLRRLITKRLSFPAYVLAYRYKNQLYRVVICGQDGNRVVGSAPYSYAKVFMVVAIAAMALLVFLALLALAAG